MGDHRLDVGEIGIGRGVLRRQHEFVVEDVEPLVLHGSHVEVGDCDDHEHVEIVLAAVARLVPAHGALEAVHGVGAARFLAGLDEDFQRNGTARHGAERIFHAGELAADQREQITGLRKGIVPDREMAIGPGNLAARDRIAVGEQDRRLALRGLDSRGVYRHHVRPVEKVGDAPEALGLALRAIARARAIEPHQLRVG